MPNVTSSHHSDKRCSYVVGGYYSVVLGELQATQRSVRPPYVFIRSLAYVSSLLLPELQAGRRMKHRWMRWNFILPPVHLIQSSLIGGHIWLARTRRPPYHTDDRTSISLVSYQSTSKVQLSTATIYSVSSHSHIPGHRHSPTLRRKNAHLTQWSRCLPQFPHWQLKFSQTRHISFRYTSDSIYLSKSHTEAYLHFAFNPT